MYVYKFFYEQLKHFFFLRLAPRWGIQNQFTKSNQFIKKC